MLGFGVPLLFSPVTTQQNYHSPSRSERLAFGRDMKTLSTFYTSPVKSLSKTVNHFDTPEQKKEAALALKGATGGKPSGELTEHDRAKEHERLVALAHEDFTEAQSAGNQWAARSTTLIETWDKIKELGYYKPKTWEAFLSGEFGFTKMQESRLRAVLKSYQGLSEPELKQLSTGSNRTVTSERKPPIKALEALAKIPEAEQSKVLAEVASEGKVTAKAIEKKVAERKAAEVEEGEFEQMDKTGFPIPKSLQPEWERSEAEFKMIDGILMQAEKLMAEKIDNDPAWNELSNNENTKIRGLRSSAKAVRPHAVCPTCGGAGKKCNHCKGHGIISKFKWSLVPKDQRKGRS